jgi:uncharacterized OB-fold protein
MLSVSSSVTGRDQLMKGMKCKCGFATVSQKAKCPRCGKMMKPSEWPDEGRVLSFTPLQAVPEGLENPYNLVLVAIDEKGPKLACWTSGKLKVNDEVTVTDWEGKYICAPKTELKSELKQDLSEPD